MVPGTKETSWGTAAISLSVNKKSTLDLLAKLSDRHTKPPWKGQNLLGAEEKQNGIGDQPAAFRPYL